jgi:(1->4)-alpha-D-glucan 1-alpha-D-glucosylmutase
VATTSEHAVAFGRGTGERLEAITVVTRLAGRLADTGGFGDATIDLPAGRWRDVLSTMSFDGGPTPLADVIGTTGLPVALLVRVRDES